MIGTDKQCKLDCFARRVSRQTALGEPHCGGACHHGRPSFVGPHRQARLPPKSSGTAIPNFHSLLPLPALTFSFPFPYPLPVLLPSPVFHFLVVHSPSQRPINHFRLYEKSHSFVRTNDSEIAWIHIQLMA